MQNCFSLKHEIDCPLKIKMKTMNWRDKILFSHFKYLMTFCENFLNFFFVLRTWFLSMVRDDFKGGKINLEKAQKLLEKLDIRCNTIHVKCIFKVR